MKRRQHPLFMALGIIMLFLLVSVSLNITQNHQILRQKRQTEQLIKQSLEQKKRYEHVDSAVTALTAEIAEIRKHLE